MVCCEAELLDGAVPCVITVAVGTAGGVKTAMTLLGDDTTAGGDGSGAGLCAEDDTTDSVASVVVGATSLTISCVVFTAADEV